MHVPARGHWWTIAPNLLGRLQPQALADQLWSTIVTNPRLGGPANQRLWGEFGGPPDARDLYLLVHGLGGDADSPYMREGAAALQGRGCATLRISMRGAGRSDADFYHAGLAADLVTVLADPSLASFERVFVVGFSLGGHVSIHLSFLAERDPRVAAIVAICAPLDLARNVEALDTPAAWIYRRHVLNGLAKIHTKVHAKVDADAVPTRARRFRTIREWDLETIVPRWGFASAEQYWRSQAAGPRLREAQIPILFLAAEHDPMVPAVTLQPHLERAGGAIDIRWIRRGGHVGFPRDLDLGLPGELGLFKQILTWTTTKA